MCQLIPHLFIVLFETKSLSLKNMPFLHIFFLKKYFKFVIPRKNYIIRKICTIKYFNLSYTIIIKL